MSNVSKIVKSVLLLALAVFILIFLGYQIYSAVYNPYKTETVSELNHERERPIRAVEIKESINSGC